MSVITRTGTLPDSSNKTDFYALIDSATVGSIVNADIDASAAVADSKLATITTAGKVSGAALTLLGNIPSAAGTVPSANIRRVLILKAVADDAALTTGDGKMYLTIPAELNGMNLVAIYAHVYTVSSSGTPTIQLYNLTDTTDMLSTRITIDENETDSATAAAAAVIDTSHDDVATADVLRVDVDVAGTGTKGLELRLSFQTP